MLYCKDLYLPSVVISNSSLIFRHYLYSEELRGLNFKQVLNMKQGRME